MSAEYVAALTKAKLDKSYHCGHVTRWRDYMGMGSTALVLKRDEKVVHKILNAKVDPVGRLRDTDYNWGFGDDVQDTYDREIVVYKHLGPHPRICSCIGAFTGERNADGTDGLIIALERLEESLWARLCKHRHPPR
jgi:hypothetical protein